MEIKTATITEKGQIAIPRQMRDTEGFKTGSKVAILTFKDHVELRPMKQVNERLFSALVSEEVLSKEWNTKEEDEAWKNL
jgi:AbrB family looped-hinge helix DNA binding protein